MQQPNPLAIILLCIGGAALLVLLLWLNHVLRAGGKKPERKTTQMPPLISVGLSYLLGGGGPVNGFEEGVPRPQEGAPTLIMSKEQPTRPDTDRAIPKPVSVSSTDTATFDPHSIPSDLTYEETVTILAGQILPSGKPAYSGKKIYSWVGGNYNDFTVLMKRLRPKDSEPAEPPVATTPVAGRQTQANFPVK